MIPAVITLLAPYLSDHLPPRNMKNPKDAKRNVVINPKSPSPTLNISTHTGTSKPIRLNVTAPGNHTQTPLPIRAKVSLRISILFYTWRVNLNYLKIVKRR
ncbi:MAG: hypothetical protein QXQ28_00780 [Candidatus Nezhaarchaeales archaeon]